mgnify:CR=1 FL=1
MKDPNLLLDLAKEAALKAGSMLKKNFGSELKATLDEGRDIKLEIDTKSEKLIIKTLKSGSNLPILSEESGADDGLKKDYWVVDPLDGSSNFFRGIPIHSVSVALIISGKPFIGVIYDFINNKLYHAIKGGGSFCNNEPIRVSGITDSKRGTIVTGIPAKNSYSDQEFKELIDIFQNWKKVRMIGSATISNVYVATGKAELYKENNIFLWDIVAGAILIEEAGGKAHISDHDKEYRVNAEFSNGKV